MDNIYKFSEQLTKKNRETLLEQKGCVIWLTGLSGSGKSTIANEVQKKLYTQTKLVYMLDGDNIRSGINSDLSFSIKDRFENIRRVAHIAKLISDLGVIVLVSFITPLDEMRKTAKEIIKDEYNLVFIDASVKECIKRDTKGLYKKAIKGEITNFTGISSPFEKPENFNLRLDTYNEDINQCTNELVNYILTIQGETLNGSS